MKTTLNRNLAIGFGFSLLLLLSSSVASFISIRSLLSSSWWVNHTYNVLTELDGTLTSLKDAESGQRAYLLTGDPVFLGPQSLSYQQSLSALQRVRSLTVDNPVQQKNAQTLELLISKRVYNLQKLVDDKRETNLINLADLKTGSQIMDSLASLINTMKNNENALMTIRTGRLNAFSESTPVIIIITSLLAILVSIFFYLRVRRDIGEKTRLQENLQEKDKEIGRRINIIRGIAEKISAGDYQIRVNEEERDSLGSLSASLNRMAKSLEDSFNLLTEKEWFQTGNANLNETMVGEKNMTLLAQHILEALARYTNSQTGAFYLAGADNSLQFTGGYAFTPGADRMRIAAGSGIVGACAVSGKEMVVQDIPPENILISYATGAARPSTIVAVPVFFEGSLKGVIELGCLHPLTAREISFLKQISYNIGIAVNTAQSRMRLQELFEETQAQSEELQAQHGELEHMNSELETQTEKLQASEEELRVQQEELKETNTALEERSKLLEEKNVQISERNSEIQKKAEQLAISTRYKSEFLANMSHELRTPLNSILLLSRLLTENNQHNLTAEQIEYAQVIQGSGNGLLQLIDEILDLSKIEAGKMDLDHAFISIRDSTEGLRKIFEPLAREKQIDFEVSIAPGVPGEIETDRMRMEQVLKNLLSNAFKFTSAGHIHLKVVPDETGDPRYICFLVEDTGIGIPADKQQLVFEAFQQADGSTKRKFGGTGLGLSISRELSRLLKGDLSLTSEAGKGAVFSFRIPVSPAVAVQKTAEVPVFPEATAVETHPEEKGIYPFTVSEIPHDIPDDRMLIEPGDKVILIVEDDTAFAKALLDYTRAQHYKGIVAVRGDVGIQLAKQYNPTGILLDIQLPVKSGWEVMDELKRDPKTRHIPVHVMSSFEARKESLSKGAVDFVNKPLAYEQMGDIFKKIEYVLSRTSSKVLIVEENPKHARALGYFLGTYDVNSAISKSVAECISALQQKEVHCVILDMGGTDFKSYDMLEAIKRTEGLENIPIIIFTGKNFSRNEESRIRQYADSIVIKTANSYQRILDEVSLFLHVVDQHTHPVPAGKLGMADEVLKDKTVLIADDDVRNIYSLTKVLEKHQMKILTAIDGREALKVLEQKPGADIVLMDMMMPEMDGFDTIRNIRKMPGNGRMPIIAVTAKAMTGDREKCISAGASDYISKPVDVDQLISLLRIWLYEK
jgi:signal transduction histidine kinase/CheY-like chemotaxis protein/CHASE3 domain sensor protein